MLREEVSRTDFERTREAVDIVQADVAFASFHLADIATIKVGSVSQTFLAETALFTKLTDSCAEILALLALKVGGSLHHSTLVM